MRTLTLLALLLCSCGGQVAEDPIERLATAICSCGDGWAGCPDNVRAEFRGANLACVTEWAETYERTCSGRPSPTCTL